MLILIHHTTGQQISDGCSLSLLPSSNESTTAYSKLANRKTDKLNNYTTKRLSNTKEIKNSVLPRTEILSPEFQ